MDTADGEALGIAGKVGKIFPMVREIRLGTWNEAHRSGLKSGRQNP